MRSVQLTGTQPYEIHHYVNICNCTFSDCDVYLSSGYSGVILRDAPLYDTDDNIPFGERAVRHSLQSGDLIQLNACYDNKSDIYFFVTDISSNKSGYLYDLRMVVKKNKRIPTSDEILYASKNLLVVMQCSLMVKNIRAIKFEER